MMPCERSKLAIQFAGILVLAVGNLQPRKNLLRLVEAFALVAATIPSAQLVIVGKAQLDSSAVYRAVKRLNLEKHVVFTDYVSNQELVLFYQAAKLFVYPSIYEGFGLPILEAMACGTPVVASNTSSMPEVAGGAALCVNPLVSEELAQAMLALLTNLNIANTLAEKGIRWAQQFSWQKTAQETLAIYRAVHARQKHDA